MKEQTRGYDILVVGGGAAGLFCAGQAAAAGKRVLLLERCDRPGRKLLITGKGRCNLTNNCQPEEFLQSVKTNSRFLMSAVRRFAPQDTMSFFESLGVPLKTERGNRVFPCSDRSVDIVNALTGYVKGQGVTLLRERCTSLLFQDGLPAGVLCESGSRYEAKAIVLATGGKSYPLTGSTGDGYKLAKQAGHTIIPTRPSLVPVVTNEDWCRRMMGLSLKNVTLTLLDRQKKKPVFSELGEMLFTHFGVSGPLVLSASAHMEPERMADYTLSIDLKPALTPEQLDQRLQRDFHQFANKDFSNSLDELLPRKLIPIAVERSGIPAGQKVHQITREQRQGLAALLKDFSFTCKGFRPIEEAIVTAGGVKVGEVNPKTMESKLAPGLYCIGELLDLDAYTGGFNLQIAFSTAFAAASALGQV